MGDSSSHLHKYLKKRQTINLEMLQKMDSQSSETTDQPYLEQRGEIEYNNREIEEHEKRVTQDSEDYIKVVTDLFSRRSGTKTLSPSGRKVSRMIRQSTIVNFKFQDE